MLIPVVTGSFLRFMNYFTLRFGATWLPGSELRAEPVVLLSSCTSVVLCFGYLE